MKSSEFYWPGELGYLNFFREIAGARAFLVNLYSVGDPRTPTTRNEWHAAIESVKQEPGLVHEVPYSAATFVTA